jgi:hypothetical protein
MNNESMTLHMIVILGFHVQHGKLGFELIVIICHVYGRGSEVHNWQWSLVVEDCF